MAVTHNLEVTGVTISPTAAPAGSQATVSVTINKPAPVGGVSISIVANPSATASLPSSVLIPQGATKVSFKATLNYVGKPTVARIYANYNTTKNAAINISVALVQPVPPTLIIPAPILSGTEVIQTPVIPPTPPAIAIPDIPTNLLLSVNPGQVAVSWGGSNGATSYKLKRSVVNGGPYVTMAITAALTFIDTGLNNGTTYYYVVTASNSAGESGNSAQASGTPNVNLPIAPTGVSAAAGDSRVTLNWSVSIEATTYNVKRSTVNGGPYTTLASVSGTSYIDTVVANGTTYYYVVTVVNINGESNNSLQAVANPKATTPGVPAGLVAVAGNTQVTLNWGSVSTALSYNVKRALLSGGPYAIVASPVTNTYVNTGLTNGTTYYYVVSAVNTGESANSSQAMATPIVLLPTPTFTDDFSTGALDTSKWIPSNWGAPGTIAGVNNGSFNSSSLDFSQGVLRISLTQVRQSDGSITSVGGELQSKLSFGYGTYEWQIRPSSTAATQGGAGNVVSGQISSGFTFINNSQTEIDFEIEGQLPATLEMTNWNTTAHKQFTSTALPLPSDWHAFRIIWAPGRVDFYLDGNLVSTHTQNIPTAPAFQMINHWGTNSTSFGGLATAGVTRYMYVRKVSFWAA